MTVGISGPIGGSGVTTTAITGAQLLAAMVAGTQMRLGPGHHYVTGQCLVQAPTDGFALIGAGMDRTFVHFDVQAPIHILETAPASNLTISDLTMVSDVVSGQLTYLGIITTRSTLDNWNIERVRFRSPDNNENAIKLMTHAGGHMRKIRIADCEFIDVANMGIEVWGDTALDVTDIEITRCLFEDVASVAGLPISLVADKQRGVRVVDCVLESCYNGIEVGSGIHVDNIEFRYARRNYNSIMATGAVCDTVISRCRETTIYSTDRTGLWVIFSDRLKIVDCITNSGIYLRGADLDISGSVFRGIDFDVSPSRVNMNACSLGVQGVSEIACYIAPGAAGSTLQGAGNRIKATALSNDAGLINTTGMIGTLVGYNA